MIRVIGIFAYFIGSAASVLVALDTRRTQKPEERGGFDPSDDETEALRSIVKKARRSQ